MLEHASRILDGQEPTKTLINIGVISREASRTVYEIAKQKGFPNHGHCLHARARRARHPLELR